MHPIQFGNWLVKGSTTDLESICILMRNIETGEVILRFFSDEMVANYFIESIVQSDLPDE